MTESPALVPLLGLFSFFAGLVFGSFANVCVHRLPRGESVVFPPSRCPACGSRIAPFDNVPVLAWLWLRGRCRRCHAPISIRYPAVEMVVGLLFLASFLLFGPTPSAARSALLSFAVVVLVLTDLRDRLLPDEITLGVLLAGFAVSLLQDFAASSSRGSLLASLLGAAVGALVLWTVRALYLAWRGVEGMGLGDVKMIAMVGAVEGPAGVFTTLLLASVAGALLGISLVAVRSIRFALVARRVRRSTSSAKEAAGRHGALIADDGVVMAASKAWRSVPGAPPPGEPWRGDGTVFRPLAAFVRLARRRARRGEATRFPRLVLDDGADFFRVLYVRAEPLPGGLLVLASRADIPFGVFLGVGSFASFVFGRALLEALSGGLTLPGSGLLP